MEKNNSIKNGRENTLKRKQCCGSVIFWYGSGFSDPYLCLTDPDADPEGPKTYGYYGSGPGCGSGKLVKSHKGVTKSKNQSFLTIFA